MKNTNLIVSALCYFVGLFGLIGIIVEGAMHQAMNVAVCLVFGTVYLIDYLEDRRAVKEDKEVTHAMVVEVAKRVADNKAAAENGEFGKPYKAPEVVADEVEVEAGIAASGER